MLSTYLKLYTEWTKILYSTIYNTYYVLIYVNRMDNEQQNKGITTYIDLLSFLKNLH
jgi:hypothetical protein